MSSDVLGVTLLVCLLVAVVSTVWSHKSDFSTWVRENWQPLLIVVASYLVGVIAFFATPAILAAAHASIVNALAKDPPGGVSGSDIIANLLTISALTITACLGYLCLPIDRVELRIFSFVKMQLRNKVLMDAAEFLTWHDQLEKDIQERPACRSIKLLLEPLEGLGGWSYVTKAEELAKIFRAAWPKYGKYVGDHLDDKWIRVLVGGLAVGTGLGLVCLIERYLGLSTKHFDAGEFGLIAALTCLNVGTGWLLITLVTDLRTSERMVHEQVEDHIDQLAPEIKGYLKQRRNQHLQVMRSEVRSHNPQPGNAASIAVTADPAGT